MRVNSTFTGFCTNMLVLQHGITALMIAIIFIASSFTEHSSHELRTKQVNIIIRKIGDRLLLQAGDSTSRVLPVTEIKGGTFLLKFEKEFVFSHDSLMLLAHNLFPRTQFPSGYTVTVHECSKSDIVYGFQVNNTTPDILACQGRIQPRGCYTIEFDLPDFYAPAKQQKAGINQLTASAKADPPEVNLKPAASKTTSIDYNNDERTKEPRPVTVDQVQVNPKHKELRTTIFGYPIINVVGGMLLLLGIALVIARFGKISKPVPGQNQHHAVTHEPVREGVALGKFLFNVKGHRLLLAGEVINLTDKECRVLQLLYKNFGELLPRETLMQEVWLNEGVITGRSLDMFISKLRKKLSDDPELRIANVHGKGYRLETVSSVVA